jgi:hypothetical protein
MAGVFDTAIGTGGQTGSVTANAANRAGYVATTSGTRGETLCSATYLVVTARGAMSLIQFKWVYIVSGILWELRDSLASNKFLTMLGTVAIMSIPLLPSPNTTVKSAIYVNTTLNMLNRGLNSPIPT